MKTKSYGDLLAALSKELNDTVFDVKVCIEGMGGQTFCGFCGHLIEGDERYVRVTWGMCKDTLDICADRKLCRKRKADLEIDDEKCKTKMRLEVVEAVNL